MVKLHPQIVVLIGFLALTLCACSQAAEIPQCPITPTAPQIHSPTTTPSARSILSFTPTRTVTPTSRPPTQTLTPTPLLPGDPPGCLEPPSEYERVTVNGWTINQRTFQMLQHAAMLYDGKIDITGNAITQGSYNDNGPASFGTHLGGGVVDISVIQLPEYVVLYDQIDPLIVALRTAGFAAWLRDVDEAYPGTGIHIHAVAIGDRELSYPAKQQLTGKSGYFGGFDGLPTSGAPGFDRHGGPIICSWMRAAGYLNLRQNVPTPSTDQ